MFQKFITIFSLFTLVFSLQSTSFATTQVYTTTDVTSYEQSLSSYYNHYRYYIGQDHATALANAQESALTMLGFPEVPIAGEEYGYSNVTSTPEGGGIMTLTETLAAVTEVFGTQMDMAGTVSDTIAGNGLLLLGFLGAMGFTAISLFKAMFNR